MKSSEAFLLHKIVYGEADYILSLFTKDFGKISGLAKHAKRSRKRFGGRLEPFVHLRVRFREKPGGIKFIEDSEIIQVFSTIMQDIDLFMCGSFILENVGILIPEEDPNERMFNLLVETLSTLDSKKSPSNVILKFQLSALSLSGYEPNFNACVECKNLIEQEGFFSIQKGGVVCNECKSSISNGFRISNDFLLAQRDWMKWNHYFLNHELKDPLEYVKLLVKFTQYRTGKEIKSSKFLEELSSD
ncbi:MAG TPA: DNA repair protein RecO [Thermodesulfobacteriota bacterium]|nr:DNA repair protein RecO [Thermodesulfobacteriota bacterium]